MIVNVILESYELYVIAKCKASDCKKIRQDLFFCFKSMKLAKFQFSIFLTALDSMV